MERVQTSIYTSLAIAGALGLLLVVWFTDPVDSRNRIIFVIVFAVASMGLCGLVAYRTQPLHGPKIVPRRVLERGATWAALLTAAATLLSEHLLFFGNCLLFLAIGAVAEMFVWKSVWKRR